MITKENHRLLTCCCIGDSLHLTLELIQSATAGVFAFILKHIESTPVV